MIRAASLAVLSALVITGCKPAAAPVPAAAPIVVPVSAEQLNDLRQTYQQIDRDVRVGRVSATLPERQLVAVEQIDANGLLPGQAITFINGRQKIIAMGSIVRVLPQEQMIHVQYTAEEPQQRAPVVGDVAIWFSR